MLVLTRRTNQSIKIGDDIEITVIEVRGDQVRLGITAPRDVAVHRKEIYLQIQQENLKAAQMATNAEGMQAVLGQMMQPLPDKNMSDSGAFSK